MIEKELVPAFRSPRNTTLQRHFAFCIQELLRISGFTPETIAEDVSSRVAPTHTLKSRWEKFSKPCIEAIRPLLVTRYLIGKSEVQPVSYPLFQKVESFPHWLETWTRDLLEHKMNTSSKAFEIFGVCKCVITEHDLTVPLFILPHVILTILLGGPDQLESERRRSEILTEILAVLGSSSKPKSGNIELDEKNQRASQMIFTLIDYLSKWVRMRHQLVNKTRAANARKAGKLASVDELDADDQTRIIDEFLSKIPQDIMAIVSYECRSYERSLLHLERHVRLQLSLKNHAPLSGLYEFCQRVYARMNEADAMEGISSMISVPSLEQQVLEHESTGNWSSAQTGYELMIRDNPDRLDYQVGLINCLRNLGHFESMVTHVGGILQQHADWSGELESFRAEAAWRLSKWDLLEESLDFDVKPSFEKSLGRSLLALRHEQEEELYSELRLTRTSIAGPLTVSSLESYERAHAHVLKLHMLCEVEEWAKLWQFCEQANENDVLFHVEGVVKQWESRLSVASSSYHVVEPLLSLRRTLMDIGLAKSALLEWSGVASKLEEQRGLAWLQSARAARKSGYLSTSYSHFLNAASLKSPAVILERCKWLWRNGENHRAIVDLRGALDKLKGDKVEGGIIESQTQASLGSMGAPLDRMSDLVKSKLALARWLDETRTGHMQEILDIFKETLTEAHRCEKVAFQVGKYYLKLYENERQKFHNRKSSTTSQNQGYETVVALLGYVIRHFARALTYGSKYIYQTLPRMLTLWLRFGQDHGLGPDESANADGRDKQFTQAQSYIKKWVSGCPSYQFLTAFPQIVSRICHKNKNCSDMLETIMVKVLQVYPQQALWQMMSVAKSNNVLRVRRIENVFSKVKRDRSVAGYPLDTLIEEFKRLTQELLNVCNHNVPSRETVLSIKTEFRHLLRLTPTNVVIPLQSLLTVSLPSNSQATATHKPFPEEQPSIMSFHDEVEVMTSLQRPRKVTLTGSDGRDYSFLCKPKDDLRKDARLMEFNTMINKLLKKDSASRDRRLYLRTYSVVPLNEECGIIEWMNNTTGLRIILNKYYKAKGMAVSNVELKEIFLRIDKYEKSGKRAEYKRLFESVLERFPPVFHEWHLDMFPEPRAWFAARSAYTRTTAVISMVGYILGLGDRHGENILLDETNGDCVHVDFNCLFEKGRYFERPELVPFRLTQNVVDAFGITGIEGVFRKSCQVTMKVLRANKDSLMSVLETFTHDPLVEWSKGKHDKNGESENDQANRSMAVIQKKLDGLIQSITNQSSSWVPLSVEGQVQDLISQAMNKDFLARMYIGWAPWY
ncbi:hypothetical protein M427DRAFT_310695 [Gonapodya prolifera JEL478]|uniref:non-specific serine/threonine protein kinase n=1 Tax=Gonapodya prolifera (strain JEL478) TaxID=1344416 RepID=A0A139AWI2_GONPJ|nr:hypothetical protein M427DRAFT_310695 [Gonapodya prolifera JEL478]|eukprot:KXS21067.1 hypothetical protein M427DRAFT_310695 [Gonapodya prolifera JEL478]